MNQQAGVFFINVPAQPANEAEAIDLAQKQVESLINATPTSPERDALTVVNMELMRRQQINRAAEARKAQRSDLQNQLSALQETLKNLQDQIARLS